MAPDTAKDRRGIIYGIIGIVAGLLLWHTAENYSAIGGFLGEYGRDAVSWITPSGGAPINGEGFRVLVVYDSVKLAKLPAGQVSILTSPEVSTYCRDHCAKGADGKTPEYRCFPEGCDVTKEPQLWQDAMKLPRQSLPWIVVSDGKSGFSGPLPANVADTLTLLRKFGG